MMRKQYPCKEMATARIVGAISTKDLMTEG